MKTRYFYVILLLFCIILENEWSIQLKIFQSDAIPEQINDALLSSSAGFVSGEGFAWSWNSDKELFVNVLHNTAVAIKEKAAYFVLNDLSGISVDQKPPKVEFNFCMNEVSYVCFQL